MSREQRERIKAELGRRIVADFHSEEVAREASDNFDRMFKEKQLPSEIPVVERAAATIRLPKLIASEGLAPSVAEAQRLISQGSVLVNGKKVSDVKFDVVGKAGEDVLLKVGKLKFLRVVFQ